jgi:acyl-CoA synthetase (AMP-forming)/AMP-acid ligase II
MAASAQSTLAQCTLAQVLLKRAASPFDTREAIVYRRGNGTRYAVTGAGLLERVQRVAAALRGQGVAPGDRVLLMLTAQADFVDAFFGAIWADAVPVPLFPPVFSTRLQDFVAHFAKIASNAEARLLVASQEIAGTAQQFAGQLGGGLRVLSPSSWDGISDRLETEPRRGPTELAFLQYTSGSTGTPKGVALSHANVLANLGAIGRAISHDENDIGVSWLPLYHDMGLIGVLCTLYWGGLVVSLSPLDFAKDPATWLRAISEHRATLSPAPNFAFRRCLRLTDGDIAGVDLSTWRVAFNGAEPVDPSTLRSFAARFAPYGFRTSALYPVYGLAEHTLAVSFPTLGQGPQFDTVDRSLLATSAVALSVPADHPNAVSFASVGAPLEGVSVEIRSEDGVALPEGRVGEVVIKSASVMTGYFRDAKASAEVLSEGWLKTGDLGYIKAKTLYITGRNKDLVIRAGRNYYPQDIESAAAQVAGVRAGRVVAFSVAADDDHEHVVLLAEIEASEGRPPSELLRQISTAVAARMGFRPDEIALRARGALPITSSGKVRREVARARFLEGRL